MREESALHQRIDGLRRAFDEAFSRPLELADSARRELLTVLCGGERLALDASELSLVEPHSKCTWLPGAPAHCLGVTGLRGRLVVVYDLAGMLGYGKAERSPAVLVSRLEPSLGVGVEKIERYVRLDGTKVRKLDCAEDEPLFAAALLETGTVPMLGLNRLVNRIKAQVGDGAERG